MSVDAADLISAGSVPQDGGCHTEYPALNEDIVKGTGQANLCYKTGDSWTGYRGGESQGIGYRVIKERRKRQDLAGIQLRGKRVGVRYQGLVQARILAAGSYWSLSWTLLGVHRTQLQWLHSGSHNNGLKLPVARMKTGKEENAKLTLTYYVTSARFNLPDNLVFCFLPCSHPLFLLRCLLSPDEGQSLNSVRHQHSCDWLGVLNMAMTLMEFY